VATYARSATMSLTPSRLLRDTTLRNILTEMMSRTNKTGLETGIVLHSTPNGLTTTQIQTGSDGSITLQFGNGRPVATAHTHPREQYEALFSPTDIRSYINGPMEFAYLVYDDGPVAVADIYQTNEYENYQHLRAQVDGTGIQPVRRMNDLLYKGTVRLGRW